METTAEAANDNAEKSPACECGQDHTDVVRRAQEFYRIGIDTSAQWREDALADLQFLAGDQWDSNIKGQRDMQGRPALTVNRLPQFVRQITNEQRQSKPAVTVNPVDSGADVRTAEVLQGVIRNIEYTSNADAAYATGGANAAITGLGYWDVCADYEDERSFDQCLKIRRISNPLSVVMDPGAKELAGDDARQVTISTDMSAAEWKALYPGVEAPKSSGWSGHGDAAADWVAKDGVRIHEYRYITEEPDELHELLDGSVILKSEAEPGKLAAHHQAAAQLRKKIETRKTSKRLACWAKIVGSEVVECGQFAGKYLQLVRVVGTEIEIDGKTIYEGVVRHARDTQRMLNYFVSAEAEAIALTPKAPWLATKKQIEGYETEWETANQRATSILPYNPDPLAPPPQRVMSEANVGAITNARAQAADDLKAVTGIYDSALGARSNETSGKAILSRQSQAQTANFHFTDNLAMAIRYTGRILVDLIPKIYSGARTLRILGEDGKHEMVPVNGAEGDFRGEPATTEQGPLIQLDAGRYDVAVSMGPSYQSRRQEAAAQLLELVRVNPVVGQVAGDLIVANMDIPGAKEIAARVAKTLPPELRPPDEKTPPAQLLAQQLQQAMAMNQQMTERLHELSDALERSAHDAASKERIELAKVHAQLMMKAAELDSKEGLALLKHEGDVLAAQLKRDGFNQSANDNREAPDPAAVGQ
jgi:hypothetical protein